MQTMARKVSANGMDDTAPSSTEERLHESLVRDLGGLYRDRATADLEFSVGPRGDRIKAHRLIVQCRCDKYRSMWAGDQGTVSVRLERTDVKSLKSVLRYIYSGKIDLRNEELFQILSLSMEFGLPMLRVHCIEHLSETLNTETVCSILIGAQSVLMESESSGDGMESTFREIVQKCLGFIEANTKAVFQSSTFLRLSKEQLTAIISSNKLALQEEDVWRAVIRWGRHVTGVEQTMLLWTEKERQRMKEALAGVLECVRVMEISSEVFANEVEPTGLLPMEMTLARYRHAAVHGRERTNSEHSRPRSGVTEPFVGSDILEGRADLQVQINEWSELPSQEWVLLYRGSRDGFHARDFHSHCDEKGATVVIVRTPSGCVFGGYTDVSWSSRFKRGKFASSQGSFLFSLVNPTNSPPAKFEIKQSAYAINNHPSNGPIFGSGADLCISSECNRNKDSYSQLPYTYGDGSLSQHLLTGEQYFTVEEYEVFGFTS